MIEKKAFEFHRDYHRRKFNQLEPDLLEVSSLLAASITLEKSGSSSSDDEMSSADNLRYRRRLRKPEVLF